MTALFVNFAFVATQNHYYSDSSFIMQCVDSLIVAIKISSRQQRVQMCFHRGRVILLDLSKLTDLFAICFRCTKRLVFQKNTFVFITFAGCIHSGVQYDHGGKWRPVADPCDVCLCLVGPILTDCNLPSFLTSSSVLTSSSLFTRRVTFAVRLSGVTPHVKTQLLPRPTPAVQIVKVCSFASL